MTVTRLISPADATEVAELLTANRDFLAPWEPVRSESYFTPEGQLTGIQDVLDRLAQGTVLPHVILDSGRIAGRITLNGIVRGPFLSCSVGYWVAESSNGRGLATAALREMVGSRSPGSGCTGSRPRPAGQLRLPARAGAQWLRAHRPGARLPADRRPVAGHDPVPGAESGHVVAVAPPPRPARRLSARPARAPRSWRCAGPGPGSA